MEAAGVAPLSLLVMTINFCYRCVKLKRIKKIRIVLILLNKIR